MRTQLDRNTRSAPRPRRPLPDLTLGNPLPNNLDAEKCVLGAILLDNNSLSAAVEHLRAEDFFFDSHQRIFSQMLRMNEVRLAIDLHLLTEELNSRGELDKAGGAPYLASLADGMPKVSNVAHYAQIVKEKSVRRKIIGAAETAAQRAFDLSEPVTEILSSTSTHFTEISASGGGQKACLNFRTGKGFAEGAAKKKWVLHGYFAAGSIAEMSAKIKIGKTSLLLSACAAILDGVPFLGQPTHKTKVLYLTEQPDTSFREAMERAGLLGREDFHVLSFGDTRGVAWPDVVRAAVIQAKRVGAGLLAVDTLSQWAGLSGDSENDSGTAIEAMNPLQFAAAQGLAVIVVRHERKSGGEISDAGRGSSAFGGIADVLLSLRRCDGGTSNRRILQAVSRFSETPVSTVIELVENDFIAVGTPGETAANDMERLVQAVQSNPHASRRELERAVGFSRFRVCKLLETSGFVFGPEGWVKK
ncbi:MAG: DnaB-like helicase N-terminal domain-containing protein [Candidatus Acidiferrum sp.]